MLNSILGKNCAANWNWESSSDSVHNIYRGGQKGLFYRLGDSSSGPEVCSRNLHRANAFYHLCVYVSVLREEMLRGDAAVFRSTIRECGVREGISNWYTGLDF